jgi:DUF4097 and DUF4098 domain-containing protein YvlB
MRIVAALSATVLLAQPLSAQSAVNRTLPLNADGAVRIYALTGTVTVRGWDQDAIRISGELGSGNRLHAGGGRTAVKAFVEADDDRQPRPSRLEVMVPARAKVWIKTATATVLVSGVSGSVDAYVIGGLIRVTGNPADLNAEAIDGNIEVIGSPGWVRAKSAGGTVSLRGGSRDATLSTVTGRIAVQGQPGAARFERARFESVTGDIVFSGEIQRGADVRFDSNGGSVDIVMAGGASAEVEASTISGTIRNGLTTSRPVRGRFGRGSELLTSAGDGGARITVRTFSGPIILRRGG